jgi:hypothetical protein
MALVKQLAGALACLALGAGCASMVALDRAVLVYDRTDAQAVAQLLLLNIARARQNQPVHFTSVSSIAATYRLSVAAGLGPAMTGDRGALLLPTLGGSAEENPTLSIAPMQGEEFTQRLLTPFEERKLTLLLRQGYDVDALLRLLGAEVRLEGGGPEKVLVHHNRPSDREGYAAFRRVVAHLSAIQDAQALHVEPLHFEHEWTVPAAAITPDSFGSIYKDYTLTYEPQRQIYRVAKKVNGRVMITNYDPSVLPNAERVTLHELAEEAPYNDILIDIRAGHTGGGFPIRGRLRLRSFHEILTFIGRGIAEEPEYQVAPDPRSPPIRDNPARSLEILETRGRPGGGTSVELNGLYYAVKPEPGYQWNAKAFSLLYQLFQMTVSAAPAAGPAITISK